MGELMIEPAQSATIPPDGTFAVYAYDTYPESSVLAGQERRRYVDGNFASEAETKAAHPDAVIAGGSGYREIGIPHTAPDWFREDDAGETWDDDDY